MRRSLWIPIFIAAASAFFFSSCPAFAQVEFITEPEVATENGVLSEATGSGEATDSAIKVFEVPDLQNIDITKPEESEAKEDVFVLFQKRVIDNPFPFNFVAYAVQESVRIGVPANTIVLILLVPL